MSGSVPRSVACFTVLAMAAVIPVAAAVSASASPAADVHTAGMVDTETGIWYLRDPLRGAATLYYGDPGDVPFLGDWDCDGVETPGLYRATDGFVYLRNSNTQGIADVQFFFGNPGDIPLAGDFNGDGCDTVSVYRPITAEVFIINQLGATGGGLGAADSNFVFGNPGDIPFVGDFDGDNVDTIGLHRTSTGRVYFRNTLSSGIAEFDYVYGDPGDSVVAGDWDGDNDDTLAVLRPSTMEFLPRNTNDPGVADLTQHFRDAARRIAETRETGSAATGLVAVAGATGKSGEVLFTDYPCSNDSAYAPPFTTVATSPPPGQASNANAVLGMSYVESPECERFVITLGSFNGTDIPANTVPASVTVENFGHRAHVTMPGITKEEAAFGIDHITGTDHLGGPTAFFVNGRAPAFFDFYTDVHYPSNRFTRAMFLSDPARIVLDTKPAPTSSGLALGPIIARETVIRDNLDPDLISPGIKAPFEVVGYGRLYFEATGDVGLRKAASQQGTGPPAVATFSGTDFLGTQTGSGYAIMASAGLAWSEFRFTIDAIDPGNYEINIESSTGLEEPPPPGGAFDTFLIVP